ncbi:hypothetical protein CPB86DRAFT_822340 [Serendipita vermifera]|nr:hypothetical protein CPB86DRAFT_822340 [Serendipita vermifera]
MSNSIDTVTSTVSSATATVSSRRNEFNIALPPDAIRFFIIAATICAFFGSITIACCVGYRIRKARMRVFVRTALEQDTFEFENVRDRIIHLRRGLPPVDILERATKSTGPGPEYFEIWIKPGSDESESKKVAWKHGNNVPHSRSSSSALKPLSIRFRDLEGLKTNPTRLGACPALSALTIDSQLAHLYLVSRSSSARKRGREDREAMKEKASTVSSTSQPAQELVLSVVISMPISHSPAEGEPRDLFLGTTTMPWASLTIDEHEEEGDYHTTMMDTGPDR